MIPFNRVSVEGRELELVAQAVANGHTAGNGPLSREAEAHLSALHDGSPTLLTTSCTHALELSARLLDLQPGDEVIVPSFTFVTSASAFVWNGATPVFVDIDPDTLNIDLASAAAAITPRTKAICIVHYAGVGADPIGFRALAEQEGLVLIEDNAHGLGGSWDGQRLGTFGSVSTLSFHETKNVTCGEGGAIVVNDAALLDRAEILREKGTDRSRFVRGLVDKYTWVDLGSSWVLSDLLAGVLVGQLERLGEIQARRQAIWSTYLRELAPWAEQRGVRLPCIPDHASHPAHMFHLRFATLADRDRFIDHMRTREVMTVFHYQPLEISPMGRRVAPTNPECPVSRHASDTLVRLPLFSGLSEGELDQVLESVEAFEPSP